MLYFRVNGFNWSKYTHDIQHLYLQSVFSTNLYSVPICMYITIYIKISRASLRGNLKIIENSVAVES